MNTNFLTHDYKPKQTKWNLFLPITNVSQPWIFFLIGWKSSFRHKWVYEKEKIKRYVSQLFNFLLYFENKVRQLNYLLFTKEPGSGFIFLLHNQTQKATENKSNTDPDSTETLVGNVSENGSDLKKKLWRWNVCLFLISYGYSSDSNKIETRPKKAAFRIRISFQADSGSQKCPYWSDPRG